MRDRDYCHAGFNDESGHGSHVSGTLAGKPLIFGTRGNGSGAASPPPNSGGIAPGARIAFFGGSPWTLACHDLHGKNPSDAQLQVQLYIPVSDSTSHSQHEVQCFGFRRPILFGINLTWLLPSLACTPDIYDGNEKRALRPPADLVNQFFQVGPDHGGPRLVHRH